MSTQSTRGVIAVVDDNDDVCLTLVEWLRCAGYPSVVSYRSAEEALDKIRKGADPAFIVTDYEMPGLSGEELLSTVSAESPGVRGAIITGYRDYAMRQNRYPVLLKGTPGFLRKLAAVVADALSETGQGRS